MRKITVVNEYLLVALLGAFALAFLKYTDLTTIPFQDGSSIIDAAKDALNLRFLLLAVFDLHCVALLYFIGGRSFKVVAEMRESMYGKVALGLILGAWILGSSGVLHK